MRNNLALISVYFLLFAGCGVTEQHANDSAQVDSPVQQIPDSPSSVESAASDTNIILDSEVIIRDNNNGISCTFTATDGDAYDTPPYFGDPTNALLSVYLRQHIPVPDSLSGISGSVNLLVSIDRSGKVINTSVKKSLHPVLDANSAACVRNMPNWKPALKNNEPIGSNIVLPITFHASN